LAFIAAGNILFEYAVSGAAVARAWTSYFATLLNHRPDDFRIIAHSLPTDYNHLDPIAVVITAVICILAVLSTKGSSRFNYIASIFHVVIILFIIVAGFTKSDVKNFTPFAPYGARGIFVSAAVLFFAYVGFDAVSTMAEETKNPGRDIPIGLVGSMAVTTVAYCLLATVLCMMVPYGQIDPDAPFSVAFEAVGWKWAKYIVAAGALKGMTTVLLVSAVGQARYLTHIQLAIDLDADYFHDGGVGPFGATLLRHRCDHRWRSPEADRLHCWHLGISGWDGGLVGARKRVGWVCCDGGDLGCGDGGACLCGAAS
ncbi:Cationic amino acid transporter 1, partial [Linum grandiflorum]